MPEQKTIVTMNTAAIKTDAWLLDDKDWVKKRREGWKAIQQQLKNMVKYNQSGAIRNEDIPFYKTYYLKGILSAYDENWLKQKIRRSRYEKFLGQPFAMRPQYLIWFYPELDRDLFLTLTEQADGNDLLAYMGLGGHCGSYAAEPGLDFFDGRSRFLDENLVPDSYAGFLVKLQGMNLNENYSCIDGIFIAIGETMRRTAMAYGRNFTLAFAFELFIDIAKQLDINAVPKRGRRVLGSFADRLSRLFQAVLYHQPEKSAEKYSLKIRDEFLQEFVKRFDAGVTDEIDTLWAKAKTGEQAKG